jgi:hypothetical protein
MRLRNSCLISVSLTLSLLAASAVRGHGQGGAPRRSAARPQAAKTVVFAVQKYEDQVSIDPVAVISGGRFTPPPIAGLSAEATPQVARAEELFIKDYFAPGRKYRVLFGGGEAGDLSVVKYDEPGCTGMTASVQLQSAVKLGGEVQALATDSAALGRGQGSRRAPTAEERSAAVELARRSLVGKRVARARLQKMETNNLTAIDLNADGRAELIGSFFIKGEGGVEDALFLIAEPRGEGFVPALSWYHHTSRNAEDMVQIRRLVDALDLDGDGTAEVVVQGGYYESHDYIIYRKNRGGWRVAYQGGGGGC